MWRAFSSALLGGFILGLIIGIILGIVGINNATIQIIGSLLGGVFGIYINIFFFKKIIGKKFKDFTLILLKTKKPE